MPKKRTLHLFLKITFFCYLYLLLTPEKLPNHLFPQTNNQKWSKNLRKGEKNFLFFFYNLVHIFPLPLRKNTKPLTFSALFITRNRKTVWENIPCKIFLFLVVYIRLVLEHLARKTYLAYIHSNPNCPCTPNTPDLHAGLPQFCMYEKHFFRTRGNSACSHMALGGSGPANEKHTTSTCTRTPILHVHIWRWELGFGFDCTLNTRNNQRSV